MVSTTRTAPPAEATLTRLIHSMREQEFSDAWIAYVVGNLHLNRDQKTADEVLAIIEAR